MTIIDIGAVRLNCRWDVLHDGPPLVLSHALGATHELWQPQVEPFCARFRLLRYDARGHGLSSVPPGPYSITDLGTDVLRLLDAQDIDRAHFCGLSMGGAVGLWLGSHAPDRIDRLVVCNALPWFGAPDAFDARIAAVRERGMTAIVEPTLERWFTAEFRRSQPESVQRIRSQLLGCSPEGYVAACAAVRDLDLRADLSRITACTLVIAGTDDATASPASALAMAAAIPGARCVEVPAAHLSNLGATAAFNAAVLGFLEAPGG
jgi:3-oxoadipate enol-lactonase